MEITYRVYLIGLIEGDETPNLSHLEEKLNEAGFECKHSLTELRNRKAIGFKSELFSMVSINPMTGGYELIVHHESKDLQQFAESYEPVPLNP